MIHYSSHLALAMSMLWTDGVAFRNSPVQLPEHKTPEPVQQQLQSAAEAKRQRRAERNKKLLENIK